MISLFPILATDCGDQAQSIATDFSHLKMLGHVFVVDDAKDLAQIVRDATRYGGSYRPEVIYPTKPKSLDAHFFA